MNLCFFVRFIMDKNRYETFIDSTFDIDLYDTYDIVPKDNDTDIFTKDKIRNIVDEFPQGTNVDFIEDLPDGRLMVRTYERGVEDETWSCGTGVTACAIVSGNHNIRTRGGDFKVGFDADGKAYRNVTLTGPAACNFEGTF